MTIIIFTIVILIISVMAHELSHGYMADFLGDPTARLAGRLTINPLKHLDIWGSIMVPLISYLLFHVAFGWAKPVPYNPYNLKNRRSGELLIAVAGPAMNIVIAIIFGTFIRLMVDNPSASAFLEISTYIVVINIVLAVFNLIPVPPLDGSKILFSLLPVQYSRTRAILEAYSPILVFMVVFFLWQIFMPLIPWLFRLITGVGL